MRVCPQIQHSDKSHFILHSTSRWLSARLQYLQCYSSGALSRLPVAFTRLQNVHNPLQWRHNERDGVSNQQPHDCLLNRLFRRRSKKTSKLRVTGLCEGNSPVTCEFPAQRASNAKMFPLDDVITHYTFHFLCLLTRYLAVSSSLSHVTSASISYKIWHVINSGLSFAGRSDHTVPLFFILVLAIISFTTKWNVKSDGADSHTMKYAKVGTAAVFGLRVINRSINSPPGGTVQILANHSTRACCLIPRTPDMLDFSSRTVFKLALTEFTRGNW